NRRSLRSHGHRLAVGREGYGAGLKNTQFKLAEQLAVGGIVDAEGALRRPAIAGYQLDVGGQGQRAGAVDDVIEVAEILAGRGFPEAHGAVGAFGHQRFAIFGEGKECDGVPGSFLRHLASRSPVATSHVSTMSSPRGASARTRPSGAKLAAEYGPRPRSFTF